MKLKRQKQQEAMARREADLAHYNRELAVTQALPDNKLRDDMLKSWTQKAERASQDVDRLRLKLGNR